MWLRVCQYQMRWEEARLACIWNQFICYSSWWGYVLVIV